MASLDAGDIGLSVRVLELEEEIFDVGHRRLLRGTLSDEDGVLALRIKTEILGLPQESLEVQELKRIYNQSFSEYDF